VAKRKKLLLRPHRHQSLHQLPHLLLLLQQPLTLLAMLPRWLLTLPRPLLPSKLYCFTQKATFGWLFCFSSCSVAGAPHVKVNLFVDIKMISALVQFGQSSCAIWYIVEIRFIPYRL
jgi:hypothetical protein